MDDHSNFANSPLEARVLDASRVAAPGGLVLRVVILMPVFNDWAAADVVIQRLDAVMSQLPHVQASVVVADDSSTLERPPTFGTEARQAISQIDVLRLRRNLGHQRAIVIGLCQIFVNRPCDAVVVMDADGEDRPEDVARLLARFEEFGRAKTVFAARTLRSEQLSFRVMYSLYRLLFRVSTGMPTRVGNFSVMPHRALSTMVVVGELWNHYAAAVYKARIPRDLLPTPRGKRIHGQSQMGFTSLVTHGLSAISVFSETVGVRLSVAAFSLCAILVIALITVIAIGFGTQWAMGGRAMSAVGLLMVAVFQVLSISLGLTLFILFSRNGMGFLPLRDFEYYVDTIETLPVPKG